ncbi:hypothetical protein [Micromonospora sp. WMMD964]|uniref:hypothetical protein n=1 Tax=Micromonospora sp. WMMD964 TaxID=3016091 RepID=UPI00249CA8AC|nr:hypothetical protein [Micromonospora sp. WMMD964]WFF02376.1 hypothetical protein O7616_06355 [Micromonospora sp. WMMD964]
MSRSLARGLLRGTLTLALVTSTTVLGSAVAHAATPRLALTALSFEKPTVDATTTATAVNRLTFTVTNTDPEAETVRGVVTLRTRSTVTGELVGHERLAHYLYGSTSENADYVSGTPQQSTYTYDFRVPRFSDSATTTWEVTRVTILAGERETTVSGDKLQAFPGSRFVAQTTIDASGPTVDTIQLAGTEPFLYVDDKPASYAYTFNVQDYGSGFWKGTLKVAGPGGQSVTTPFTWERPANSWGGITCGGTDTSGGEEATYVSCTVLVTLPAGATPGNWRVAQLVLFNNAGVRTTYQNPTTPSVTVTSNSTVQASEFAVSSTEVNNWREDAIVELSVAVTGALRGVASTRFWFDNGCGQSAPPVTRPDGHLAVTVRVSTGTEACSLTGVAIVDGAGRAALYGSMFGAPDPQIRITRVASTEPPTALGATISPKTAPASELYDLPPVELTISAALKVAPARIAATYVYDVDGNVVYQSWGSGDQAEDGTLTDHLYLAWYGLTVGEYTIGFTLTDAAERSTSYGVLGDQSSEPMPGGPLIFTVTEG